MSFPSWIDPVWHNRLMGFLHCQQIWPWLVEGASFTEAEAVFIKEASDIARLSGVGPLTLRTWRRERYD